MYHLVLLVSILCCIFPLYLIIFAILELAPCSLICQAGQSIRYAGWKIQPTTETPLALLVLSCSCLANSSPSTSPVTSGGPRGAGEHLMAEPLATHNSNAHPQLSLGTACPVLHLCLSSPTSLRKLFEQAVASLPALHLVLSPWPHVLPQAAHPAPDRKSLRFPPFPAHLPASALYLFPSF